MLPQAVEAITKTYTSDPPMLPQAVEAITNPVVSFLILAICPAPSMLSTFSVTRFPAVSSSHTVGLPSSHTNRNPASGQLTYPVAMILSPSMMTDLAPLFLALVVNILVHLTLPVAVSRATTAAFMRLLCFCQIPPLTYSTAPCSTTEYRHCRPT